MNLNLDDYHWRTCTTETEFERCVRENAPAVCFNAHLMRSGGILLGPNLVDAINNVSLEEKKLLALNLLNCAVARGESELLFIIFINGALIPATRLSNGASLSYLQLQNCGINDQDAEVLADLLRDNCSLTYLGLYNNNIEDNGTAHLAQALAGNDNLLTLNLSRNLLSDDAAVALALALEENFTLQFLDLSMNLVSDQGCKALIKAVDFNTNIIYINIFTNAIKKKLEKKLIAALGRNESSALARLDREKAAYVDVFQNRLKGSWKRAKLMVVGQGRAGKTSTVRTLLGKQFDPHCISTLGAEITQTRVQKLDLAVDAEKVWKEVNNDHSLKLAPELAIDIVLSKLKENRVEVNEHSKDEESGWFSILSRRSRKFMKSLKRPRRSMYSEANEISEERITAEADGETIIDEEQLQTDTSTATLVDNTSSIVDDNQIKPFGYKQELFNRNNLQNIESSFVSFSIWDYGGQTVFYSLHHLFLTKFGLYLVVFNTKDFLDFFDERKSNRDNNLGDNPEEYIKFWLNSCDMHAPGAPILIVGTFCDDVDSNSNLGRINASIGRLVEARFSQIVPNNELLFFPVDNKSQNGVNKLRMTIESTAATQDFVNYQVSIWWMKCLDEIFEYAQGQSWIKLEDFSDIAERNHISNANETGEMLSLFHELGMIVYLNNTEALRAVVTLNPQWLLTCLGKLIHDVQIHSLDTNEIKRAGLQQDVLIAYEKGLVSRDLLEFLWKDEKENIDFLLDLMKHTIMLSEWKVNSPNLVKDKRYLIPSLLQAKQAPEEVAGFMCMFDFSERYLPIGIFERIVCLLVGLVGQEQKKYIGANVGSLYKNWCTVNLDSLDTTIFLEKKQDYLVMMVDCAESCSTIFQMMSSMLKKVNEEIMGNGLRWKAYFEDIRKINGKGKRNRMLEYEHAQKAKLSPWFLTTEIPSRSNISQERVLDSFLDTL